MHKSKTKGQKNTTMQVEDEENPNSLSTQRQDNTNLRTEEESSKDEVQPQINTKVPVQQTDIQIQFSSPDKVNKDDNEFEILALWYGNPEKDTMSAEDWLESVENAIGEKTQFREHPLTISSGEGTGKAITLNNFFGQPVNDGEIFKPYLMFI